MPVKKRKTECINVFLNKFKKKIIVKSLNSGNMIGFEVVMKNLGSRRFRYLQQIRFPHYKGKSLRGREEIQEAREVVLCYHSFL